MAFWEGNDGDENYILNKNLYMKKQGTFIGKNIK